MIKKVLLVEDDPNDVELTRRALRICRIQNELVVVRDGVDALDYLRAMDKTDLPVVILLDLKLPRMDGLEVLRWIRADEKCRHIPVVIFTSYDDEEALITSYNLGVNSYMVKPVNFEKFVKAVEILGLYWLILNKAAHE
mgnify:CR=1 FL=1